MNERWMCRSCHCARFGNEPTDHEHGISHACCPMCGHNRIVYLCECELRVIKDVATPPAEASAVDHPAHYNAGGIETIEVIASMGLPVLDGFCRGNATKYIMRGPHKGSYAEDLRKAAWYLEYLAAAVESAEESSR